MIIRTHLSATTVSTAVYSPCETYRYTLTRLWDASAPRLLFVMLNPSTASETRNDPTVARCEARTRAMGYGGFQVANLFAFRATDPRALHRAADPVGTETDRLLVESADWADAVICAWGNHGSLHGRGATVAAALPAAAKPLLHLGLTATGQPRHPLYVKNGLVPVLWLAS